MPLASRRRIIVTTILVFAAWAIVAFVVESPKMPSGDSRVKWVQAQSLVRTGFRSMALVDPTAVADQYHEFFPLRPPFVIYTPVGIQIIWSPAVVLMQAPIIAAFGFEGLIALSLLCGLVVLWAARHVSGVVDDWRLLVVIGLGTCFWYYVGQPLEHAPALAAGMAAVVLASRPGRRAVVAGLLLGLGVVLRDETLLLFPLVAYLLWEQQRRIVPILFSAGALVSVLVAAGLIDTLVYQRPPAAHLLSAVNLLQSVLPLSDSLKAVPAVAPMSLRDRFNTVVFYWLAPSLSHTTVYVFVAAMAVAAALARWKRSFIGVVAIGIVLLVWSGFQLANLIETPRSIPGLVTLSPFVVFALLPSVGLSAETTRRRRVIVGSTVLAIVIAILTTNTAGGKALGPRMLLVIIPLMATGAWMGIAGYLASPDRRSMTRVIGWAGAALVVISIGINFVALLGVGARSQRERLELEAVDRSPIPIVLTGNPATTQAFLSLYFKKVLLLATTDWRGRILSERLAEKHVPAILYIAYPDEPPYTLPPYRLASSRTVGQLVLQEWVR